jgi:hypothetical protein
MGVWKKMYVLIFSRVSFLCCGVQLEVAQVELNSAVQAQTKETATQVAAIRETTRKAIAAVESKVQDMGYAAPCFCVKCDLSCCRVFAEIKHHRMCFTLCCTDGLHRQLSTESVALLEARNVWTNLVSSLESLQQGEAVRGSW